MSHNDVFFRAPRNVILLAACHVLLIGCDEADQPDLHYNELRESRTVPPVEIAQAAQHKKSGSLQLGDSAFEMNVIVCVGTSTATVTASDSQSRSDYPVVMMRVYDPVATGGYSTNTASAIFKHDGYTEHWTLNEGDVEKNGDVFIASGTLKGNRLETQSDGTRKSVPLAGKDILPFETQIEC